MSNYGRLQDAHGAHSITRYDFFKTSLLSSRLPVINYQFRDNLLCHSVASCLAGTVATSRWRSPFQIL